MGLKLHLGCGARSIPGWVHIDAIAWPHVDICHDIADLPMLEEGSVDIIYTCHTLEHFTGRSQQRVLREWWRILRPGGILRVSVPDLVALIRVYQASGDLSTILGPLFGRQDYLYNFHYTVFDEDTLRTALEAAGFTNICRYNWKDTEHSGVDDYSQAYWPHMDKENGILISLNVEATK